MFYGLIFVLVPMTYSRVGRAHGARAAPVLVYFSLLGFAFMTLELVFIQVFTKLIGYPLYALATVITVMLIAAALGSLSSRRVAGPDGRRWRIVFAGLLAAGFVMWLAYPAISSLLLTAPLPLRIAATAALIGPLAFFMGMPFPLGLLELASYPRGAVAWAWSMNGLFTTIGGVASALLSLAFGFRSPSSPRSACMRWRRSPLRGCASPASLVTSCLRPAPAAEGAPPLSDRPESYAGA